MGEENGTEWPDDSDPFEDAPLNEDTVEQSLPVEEEPLTEAESQSSSDGTSSSSYTTPSTRART